jgi:hypothetical protein
MIVLEDKLKKVYENIIADPNNDTYVQEYERVKLEYELLYHHHMKGLIIRSKAKWYEEGEKCTKYFMNLEKRNVNRKIITNLVDNEGKKVTSDDDIIKMQMEFYQGLYKIKGQTSESMFDNYVKDMNVQRLSEEDKDLCEILLTNDGCVKAL